MVSPPPSPSAGPSYPQLPPETYNYLIHALLSLQRSSGPYGFPVSASPAAGPSYYPAPPTPLPAGPAQPATSPTLQDPEDAASVAEDKRRRNTAASARFRVKKKLKTLNLERAVADLSGRTEELEREAADLRRENVWLKEIVLLRGRNLAALNHASQVPAPQLDDDDRTHAESQAGSRKKGKGKGR